MKEKSLAINAQALPFHKPDIRALSLTKKDSPFRLEGHGQYPRIIHIDHRNGLFPHVIKQLSLGLCHTVQGSEFLQVSRPNVGHQSHIGIRHLGQLFDFSEIRTTELKHHGLLLGIQSKKR